MVERKTACVLTRRFENKRGWYKKSACIILTDVDSGVGLQTVDVFLGDIGVRQMIRIVCLPSSYLIQGRLLNGSSPGT